GADPQRPSSEVIGAYFDSYEQTFGLRRDDGATAPRTRRDEPRPFRSAIGRWSCSPHPQG
ncbi:hypothetical protein ACWCPC_41610, partial [Streptomyces decoyicus]